jgi:hypothetical protein
MQSQVRSKMDRTIEVGRAVLASSTQNLELWLTTLIVFLPSQQSINIGQLSSHSLLHHLSSGEVWVGRGNCLRLEVSVTLRGEPLPLSEFQELLSSLIEAPVSGLTYRRVPKSYKIPRYGSS